MKLILFRSNRAECQRKMLTLQPKAALFKNKAENYIYYGDKNMAIPVTNIPVLTGEVAERFIEQCEYNAKHLAGSEYRGEFEDIYKDIIARSPFLQK